MNIDIRGDNFFQIVDSTIPTRNKDMLFVTAFKDINRGQWKFLSRSLSTYFSMFMGLVHQMSGFNLVVYVEPEHMDIVREICQGHTNITLLNLNDVPNLFYSKYSVKAQECINKGVVRSLLVRSRYELPEHVSGDYCAITCSKFNFVRDALNRYPQYRFFSWIDFGYVRTSLAIPASFDTSILPENKIVIESHMLPWLSTKSFIHKIMYPWQDESECFTYVENLEDFHMAPTTLREIINDEPLIKGFGFIVPAPMVLELERLCEEAIVEGLLDDIVDDDQNILMVVIRKYPQKFALLISQGYAYNFYKELETAIKHKNGVHCLQEFNRKHKSYMEKVTAVMAKAKALDQSKQISIN